MDEAADGILMGTVKTWRDEVIGRLDACTGYLTLAADPDELLLEERMLQRIDELGFDLLTYDDPIAFRFAFESRNHAPPESGEAPTRRVLVRVSASDTDVLPFDLLARGHRVSFGLGDLFPNLSYPVVAWLDRSDLDALSEALRDHPPAAPLGERATRDYVLRHVFGVVPDAIKREEDLLRFLLRRHYKGLRVPAGLDDHLVEVIEGKPRFANWPLERIVRAREAFFAFLQERWPPFLDSVAAGASVREGRPAVPYETRFPGPVRVSFDHDDVRVYVDNLFHEGWLKPVPHPMGERLAGSWAIVGVTTDAEADRARRMCGLLRAMEGKVPGEASGYREWLAFARSWAELTALGGDSGGGSEDSDIRARRGALRDRIDQAFAAWLAAHYATLHNQPPVPPVMVHHVPRLLARRLAERSGRKVALVVVDGLAMDQWVVLRERLASQRPGLRLREGGVFAWVPTLTSVSRQACFAGRPPLYFASAISGTAGEPAAWRRFWADEGLPADAVRFEKTVRDGDDLHRVAQLVSSQRVRAVALVVDIVDRIMHGMVLGSSGMRSQVAHWADGGAMAELLDVLTDAGFSVLLTSDHGNIETRGCGRPAEGELVDTYGKRVRIYSDTVLRDRVREHFPAAIPWPSVGLPPGYHPLMAPGRSAFVREGEKPVAHGGASLEEVIVPLVEIEAE